MRGSPEASQTQPPASRSRLGAARGGVRSKLENQILWAIFGGELTFPLALRPTKTN